jgi:hypothetical protein
VKVKAIPNEELHLSPLLHVALRRRFEGAPHLPHLSSTLRANRVVLTELGEPHMLLKTLAAIEAGELHRVEPIVSMFMSFEHKNRQCNFDA